MPPDYSDPFMIPFAILIMAGVYAGSRGRLDRNDLIVIIPFLFFGMLAVRNLYPAMIVTLPSIAAGIVPEKPEVRRADSQLVVGAVAGVLLLGAVAGLTRPAPLSEDSFPTPAALELIDSGPLFHGSGSGGFFIYAHWPQRSVFIDDRAELYGADYFESWLELRNGIGWQERFPELGISQALLMPGWPLTEALVDAGWIEVYRNESFVVARLP